MTGQTPLLWAVLTSVISVLVLVIGFFARRLIVRVDHLGDSSVSTGSFDEHKKDLTHSVERILDKIEAGFKDVRCRMDQHMEGHDGCENCKPIRKRANTG